MIFVFVFVLLFGVALHYLAEVGGAISFNFINGLLFGFTSNKATDTSLQDEDGSDMVIETNYRYIYLGYICLILLWTKIKK